MFVLACHIVLNMRWNDVFTRSSIGPNVFYLRGSDTASSLLAGGHHTWNILHQHCTSLNLPSFEQESNPSLNSGQWKLYIPFLDGGFVTIVGESNEGLQGSWIAGFDALRFMLHKLEIRQPRRFKYEAESRIAPGMLLNRIHYQIRHENMHLHLLELRSIFDLHEYIRDFFIVKVPRSR